MLDFDPLVFPKLRPVEVKPSARMPGAFDVFDPSGIAQCAMTLSSATLAIMLRMDGRRDRPDIQAEFLRRTGRMLYSDELDRLIRQLDDALFLEGPRFEAHWRKLSDAYRERPTRAVRDVESLGAPVERLGDHLDEMMKSGRPNAGGPSHDGRARVRGIIAPHLDYARGGPCYAAAYDDIGEKTDARRFVILGTNHFGRSRAVVGTRKDFETPFGVVPHDAAFMRRLDERCGRDLSEYEYDHAREHSVELQVILLKRLLGERDFKIASYLCPDPCGPTGTAPADGDGVDLREFALALRAELAEHATPTCIIAGADLSHVGRYFGDERELSAHGLQAVEDLDRQALRHVESGDAEGFRQAVAASENDTNICSVGCIYAAIAALDGRTNARLLHYHQALIKARENCVTCAAVEFVAR